jgi:hypothetical protein
LLIVAPLSIPTTGFGDEIGHFGDGASSIAEGVLGFGGELPAVVDFGELTFEGLELEFESPKEAVGADLVHCSSPLLMEII